MHFLLSRDWDHAAHTYHFVTDSSPSITMSQCHENCRYSLSVTAHCFIFRRHQHVLGRPPARGQWGSFFFLVMINDTVINILVHLYLFACQINCLFPLTFEVKVIKRPHVYLCTQLVQEGVLGLPCLWPSLSRYRHHFPYENKCACLEPFKSFPIVLRQESITELVLELDWSCRPRWCLYYRLFRL